MSSLTERLLNHRKEFAKGIYFIEGEQQTHFLPYASLYQNALHALGGLQAMGVQPGDEVVLQIQNNADFVCIFWACILGRIIPVPLAVGNTDEQKLKVFKVWSVLASPWLISPQNNQQKLQQFAEQCADSSLKHQYEQNQQRYLDLQTILNAEFPGQIHKAQPDDLAFIQFSSGSTGTPKGVTVTHRALETNCQDIATALQMDEGVCLSWMPLTHDMGLIFYHLLPLLQAWDQYLMPTQLFIRRPLLWLHKVSEYRATILGCPNFGYRHTLRQFRADLASHWDLSCIVHLVNGAEPISPSLAQEFIDTLAPYGMKQQAMNPAYGLAEATLMVSSSLFEFKALHCKRASLGIGQQVEICSQANTETLSLAITGHFAEHTEVCIRDEQNQVLPDMHVGRIHVRGPSVTQGYYLNPEASQRVIDAEGWLDTGDLGFLYQQQIVITGRYKDILFMNGQNYYAHDIERLAEELDDVELNKVAVCAVRSSDSEQDELLVFVQTKPDAEAFAPLAQQINQHIAQRVGLPVSHCLPIRQLPKTTSGKLQRYLLAERYLQGQFREIQQQLSLLLLHAEASEEVPDESAVQSQLRQLLCELLGIKSLSPRANLISLGCDSLRLMQLSHLIEQHFQVRIKAEQFYTKLSLGELSHCIEEKLSTSKTAPAQAPIAAQVGMSETRLAPLSYPQEQIWLICQRSSLPVYNEPVCIQMPGQAQPQCLQQALNHLLQRHGVLRTRFINQQGQLHQIIDGQAQLRLEELNVCGLEDADEQLSEALHELILTPFALEETPLLRALYVQENAESSSLYLVAHHLLVDGLSLAQILLPELHQTYHALLAGEAPQLAPLGSEYAEFAEWQRIQSGSPQMQHAVRFWRDYLAGLNTLALPTDRPHPPQLDFQGADIVFDIPAEQIRSLKLLCQEENATLFMGLLSVFFVLLHRYTGQTDIPIGTIVNLREQARFANTLGLFLNTLVVRADLKQQPSFRRVLRQIREHALHIYAHRDLPFTQILQSLNLPIERSVNPLFQTAFVLEADTQYEDWSLDFFQQHSQTAKFDLTLVMAGHADGSFSARFEYRTALFDEARIAAMAEHYQNLLGAICLQAEQPISYLPLLSDEEINQLRGWNQTAALYPAGLPVQALVSQQAHAQPEGIAAVWKTQNLSYVELEQRANQIAHRLLRLGAQPRQIIALSCERGFDMLVGMLGILKIGAAYLPLDPNYPPERKRFMLSDAGVRILLTQRPLSPSFAQINNDKPLQMLLLDELPSASGAEKIAPECPANSIDDMAYMIYTSGSTGQPKGVGISQRSLLNLVYWHIRTYQVTAQDRASQFASHSFDASVWEIWPYLVAGARVCLFDNETRLSYRHLLEWLQQQAVTLCFLPTPVAEQFLREASLATTPLSLRALLTGGDQLHAQDLSQVPFKLYNHYGPTENTVVTTAALVDATSTDTPPIGKPISNTQLYVLDEYQQLLPPGIPGELYIGGAGLALGYHQRPELNQEKFIHCTLPGYEHAQRLYRTGDRVRHLDDGSLEFLGRIDHQVKLRGYRIELGEIEACLQKHPSVRSAAVCMHEGSHLGKHLAAYVVSSLVAERLPLQQACQLSSLDDTHTQIVQTENISSDGIGLCAVAPRLQEGQLVSLQLRLPEVEDTLNLRGEISWRQGERAGVHFHLKPQQQAQLRQALDRLFNTLGFVNMLQRTVANDLRQSLNQQLPDYMVPSSFNFLRELPLNANGKLDLKALPEPSLDSGQHSLQQPSTEMEQILAEIWQQTTGKKQLGIDDNFFDWGGNSLLIMEVHRALEQSLLREIPVTLLFQHSTIRSLAACLEQDEEDIGTSLQTSQDRAEKRKAARRHRRGRPVDM